MTASAAFDEILLRARRSMGETRVGGMPRSRGERLWKGLSSTGSAFVKRIPGAGVQHPRQLAGQVAYVNDKAKGVFGFATGLYPEGDTFEPEALDDVMAAWAKDWKGRPPNGHTSHVVLSFPEDVSHEAAFLIAQDWCAEMFESETHVVDAWEYVAGLHTDTPNPHVHVLLNNRGLEGTWFSLSSRGIFTPQMLRDRMTEIAEEYGVQLESLTRADRGLYRAPITSAEIFAAREGRVLSTQREESKLSADWRRQDMARTALLYTALSEFAETIEAPEIAGRAVRSANALFAGQAVTAAPEMDGTVPTPDLRTALVTWVETNRDALEGLEEDARTEILGRVEAVLEILETDAAPAPSGDLTWTAFRDRPSSYLIPDAEALMARAALYVPEEDEALLQAFDREGALETYLVTGQVPSRFAHVLPVIADAYAEMHDHRLDEIPKEMVAYIRRGMAMGLDGAVLGARLIEEMDDPVAAMMAEREDIARIVARCGGDLSDPAALERAEADYRDFQMALGEVEERIIAESTVYDREGVARLLQDAASTAATTGRADLADSAVGRDVLKGFVALEGRGAMQDLAGGDMDALADYVATPAHRRLAARELFRSAGSVDVGLGPDEIESGLEAVDSGYSRDGGYSI